MAEHNKGEEASAAEPGGEMSLWDLTDPIEAMDSVIALYGSKASLAAASAAFTARYAGREADFRFWYTVFTHLRHGGTEACPFGDDDPIGDRRASRKVVD
ncbi:hypothetical protein [Chelativorans alearense]|uniref:hypothetical protein n=1 Tax=Chelativorans alearense TaxID=2681495 RepID=UPI0013CF413A|nr:hypothetical protein [Chelativorans alearense]